MKKQYVEVIRGITFQNPETGEQVSTKVKEILKVPSHYSLYEDDKGGNKVPVKDIPKEVKRYAAKALKINEEEIIQVYPIRLWKK